MRRIAACLLLLVGSACASVLPKPQPPESLYRFDRPGVTYPIGSDILIREPDSPRPFGGRAIVSEAADGSLRLVRGAEWSDRATRLFQIAMLESFSDEGGAAISADIGAATEYDLSWRLSDFTLHGDRAVCRVEATLVGGRSRHVIDQTDILVEIQSDGNANAARARALADAGLGCVSRVAHFVSEQTKTPGTED